MRNVMKRDTILPTAAIPTRENRPDERTLMTPVVLQSRKPRALATTNVGLSPKPIRNSSRAIGSENAHPGAAVWVPLAILFALSAAAYFLFLAKATATWPFGP